MARGTKTGGRKAGTPNKLTVERQREAARVLGRAKVTARPLAKDRLGELLDVALGAMQQFQPITKEMVERAHAIGNTKVKERKGEWRGFGSWWDRAVFAAKELAKYESPQLKAIAMVQTPEPHSAARNEGSFVRLNDPVRASRVYQEFMKAPRQLSLPPPAKRSAG
jgi:hypothetical protein